MANETKTGEGGQAPTEAGSVVKVPTATMCRLFGISDVHLGKLAAAGHVFRAGIGQYDLWASVRGYIGFLQKRVECSGRKAPEKLTLTRVITPAMAAALQPLGHFLLPPPMTSCLNWADEFQGR